MSLCLLTPKNFIWYNILEWRTFFSQVTVKVKQHHNIQKITMTYFAAILQREIHWHSLTVFLKLHFSLATHFMEFPVLTTHRLSMQTRTKVPVKAEDQSDGLCFSKCTCYCVCGWHQCTFKKNPRFDDVFWHNHLFSLKQAHCNMHLPSI